MRSALLQKSDITYIGNLTKASYDGLTSALTPAAWVPAAIGAILGLLAVRVVSRKPSAYKAALIGAGVGFTTRAFTKTALRSTVQKVNGVRDAHWLERHPINYA